MVKITIKKFKGAVLDSGGVITTIAQRVGVSRKSIYEFMERTPGMKELRLDEEEKILDMAEISLFSQVKNKDFSATKYILSNKGRSRGYNERPETEINISQHEHKVIQVNIPPEVKQLIEIENER